MGSELENLASCTVRGDLVEAEKLYLEALAIYVVEFGDFGPANVIAN